MKFWVILSILSLGVAGFFFYCICRYRKKLQCLQHENIRLKQMKTKHYRNMENIPDLCVEQLKRENDTLKRRIDEAKSKFQILHTRNQSEIQQLRRELANRSSAPKDSSYQEILKENDALKQELSRVQYTIRQLQDKVSSSDNALQGEYAALLKSYQQSQQQLNKMQAQTVPIVQYQEMRKQNEQLQRENKRMKELQVSRNESVSQQKSADTEIIQKYQNLEQMYQKNVKQMSELQEINRQQQVEVKHLQETVQQCKEQLTSAQRLKRTYIELQQKYQQLLWAYQQCREQERHTTKGQGLRQNHEPVAQNILASVRSIDPQKMSYYLTLCTKCEKLEQIESAKYLSVSVDLSGDLKMFVAGNYRNALVVLLKTGELLPNPYYFSQLSAGGETGKNLERLKYIFQFQERLFPDAKYLIQKLIPAKCQYENSNYELQQAGQIWLEEI